MQPYPDASETFRNFGAIERAAAVAIQFCEAFLRRRELVLQFFLDFELFRWPDPLNQRNQVMVGQANAWLL